ncbi:MAG TPA: hypothetical protein VG839_08425, partial [Asticcacaulis sp.]|nr:hypothetical protein [Asticcacaulis sp.]
YLLWREGHPFVLPAFAAGSLTLVLVVFFAVVFPANVATRNWQMVPANWERLRANWETGHAVSAVLTLLALGLLIAARMFSGSDVGK